MSKNLEKIRKYLKDHFFKKRVIISYSGGIDSLLLSILLSEVAEVLCIFIKTPYISNWALKNAIKNANQFNLKLKIINVNKMVENREERCYYCKKMFYNILSREKDVNEYDLIVDGTNYDDLFDNRPGLKAKNEFKIRSPFAELKIRKKEILKIANELNISIPPKETCLLTRFEYNRKISISDLKKIEELEEFLRNYVKGAIRVRDYKNLAIIEIEDDLNDIINKKEEIIRKFKSYRFKKVCINLEGYKSY
ncbi:PP-loop domain protein [Methanocaldococcus vulcanius M7]|uniref:PP-loop domain protein n=1 Tax=Methanocaldococcus vulcanius (strain ATCC 700851 / DSM 12094 / M7) TaxID=579137 RepID=C9REJ4_METVM|nr:ATP-dependent sacrificial sulfur transferase LarE [Methanocaldococcus vulcanius]ACX71996.1 PP-loop domain protein [Methanocaldococcus vulcanius M7]